MTADLDVNEAVARAHRREWARVLAAAVRVVRDLDLAEECAQDAFAQALRAWNAGGAPARPGAWLTTVARNYAKDVVRRESVLRSRLPLLVMDDVVAGPGDGADAPVVDDDRLRLVFVCCHPALSRDAQVALTLRLVCGLSTAEVARAFLVREPAMAARITRAKKKISRARIPYRMPSRADLPERVGAVLDVVHLVFTTGHAAPIGEQLVRRDLVDGAIHLARTLHRLLPKDGDVAGLLALMLLTDARRDSRLSDGGELVRLADQDRTRWDRRQIEEGAALLAESLQRPAPTRYAVQAALAAVHAEAATWEDTDWVEIVGLYDVLYGLWPSPVVALNRAVAVGFRDGPEAGLAVIAPLREEPALATYAYLSSTRADLLRRLGRWTEAAAAYEEALAMTDNEVERAFLTRRLEEVRTPPTILGDQ
jgi:RNA polymerase sigma-70 factor (ECF subfamily)